MLKKLAVHKASLLLVACTVTATCLAGSTSAQAADAPITATPDQSDPNAKYLYLMDLQAEMNAAADEITAAIEKSGSTGLAGISVSPETEEIMVNWKGTLPKVVSQEIASIEKEGHEVTVEPAEHSLKELKDEAQALIADEASRNVPANLRAQEVQPLPDGSGLEITVRKLDPQAQEQREEFDVESVEVAGPDVPLTRQSDNAPYYAGSRQISYTFDDWGTRVHHNTCTTGFSVRRTGGYHGYLTAAHCGRTLDFIDNGAGKRIGDVQARYGETDNMYVGVSSSGGRVFDGEWNRADGWSKPVKGKGKNYVGNLVCMSGSFSGTICDIKITNVNATATIGVTKVINLIEARHISGGSAGGHGDSGGPVFVLAPGDPGSMIARGQLSVGTGQTVACRGLGGRSCYNVIKFTDITEALKDFPGVTLAIG